MDVCREGKGDSGPQAGKLMAERSQEGDCHPLGSPSPAHEEPEETRLPGGQGRAEGHSGRWAQLGGGFCSD